MATETSTQISRQDFGQEVAPYAQTLLGNAQYLTDNSPYKKYTGERIAQFDPLQTQAFDAARDLGENQYTRDAATGIAGLAQRAGNLYYNGSQYQNPYQNPYSLGYDAQGAYAANAGPAERFYGENAYAAQLGAAPTGQYQQFGGPRDVNAERVDAPNLRDLRMDAARDVTSRDYQSRDINAAQMGPAERVETRSFAQPGSADAYMSPYMQSVVGIQQREAQRQADIAGTARKSAATSKGAFGGSRAAIMDAEADRNLATQKGDIQAQGLQAAYQQAQQQFNTEQGQGLQAQTANQQAGLTVGQQNLNAQQQTNVQNEANRLQAQGLTASQAMQAALANQGVQQQANVQNLSAGLQTQGLGAQTGLQAQQANQQTGLSAQQSNQGMDYNTAMQNAQLRQQMGLANQAQLGQYGLQQGQFNQAANMQTAAQRQAAGMGNQQAANQMAQYNTSNQQQAELANQAARNRAAEFGSGQELASAQNRAQYGQATNQLNEQSRQYGAGYGLQGMQAGMTGYGNLSNVGNTLYGQDTGAVNMQNQFGTQRQNVATGILQNQYGDFQAEQNAPYKNISFMSEIVRGLPATASSNTMSSAPAPSMLSQVGGFGAAALGAYGAGGGFKANGGMVGRYAKGGLVRSRPQGLVALAIHSMT